MKDPAIRFESFGVSHPGKVRQLNEDRFLVAPRSGLWLVADGMGGHDAGDVASSCIVEHMKTLGVASSAPDLRARFEDRMGRANAEIRDIAEKRGATIGATMAALLTFERQFACLWIGDSRVYLVREGRITQLSHDHTEVQELLDRGVITPAEARVWPRRNVITRAVGVEEDMAVDIELGHIEPGDVFVVGSDGLTAHAGDADILDAVTEAARPEETCNRLLDIVLERGGTDNVTIVVVMCQDAAAFAGDHTFVPRVGLGVRHGE